VAHIQEEPVGWLTFKNVPLTFKKNLVRAAVQQHQQQHQQQQLQQ
jgi:hypothetical protein